MTGILEEGIGIVARVLIRVGPRGLLLIRPVQVVRIHRQDQDQNENSVVSSIINIIDKSSLNKQQFPQPLSENEVISEPFSDDEIIKASTVFSSGPMTISPRRSLISHTKSPLNSPTPVKSRNNSGNSSATGTPVCTPVKGQSQNQSQTSTPKLSITQSGATLSFPVTPVSVQENITKSIEILNNDEAAKPVQHITPPRPRNIIHKPEKISPEKIMASPTGSPSLIAKNTALRPEDISFQDLIALRRKQLREMKKKEVGRDSVTSRLLCEEGEDGGLNTSIQTSTTSIHSVKPALSNPYSSKSMDYRSGSQTLNLSSSSLRSGIRIRKPVIVTRIVLEKLKKN